MKAFRKLLEELNLYKDTSGATRSLYSLRHTYATNAVLNGVDFETLAVQMGTSVGMLERYYSKLKPEMRASVLGGFEARARIAKQAERNKSQKALESLIETNRNLAQEITELRKRLADFAHSD